MSPLSIQPGSLASEASIIPLDHKIKAGQHYKFVEVDFTTYFFSCDKMPIDMKMLLSSVAQKTRRH